MSKTSPGADLQPTQADAAYRHGVGNYVSSLGSAAAVTIFDGVQNEKGSALMKTGGWFARVFADGNQQAIWFVMALAFFCLFACLVTFAYRPKSAKEAFLLGASVLALLNALVKSPLDSSFKLNALLPLPAAHAQQTKDLEPPAKVPLWLVVDGLSMESNRYSELFVYDARNGKAVFKSTVPPATKLELPPGDYYFEINHGGYRNVQFKADIQPSNKDTVALRAELKPMSFIFDNLFGPKQIAVKDDPKFAQTADKATASCLNGEQGVAKAAIQSLSTFDQEKLQIEPVLWECFRKK